VIPSVHAHPAHLLLTYHGGMGELLSPFFHFVLFVVVVANTRGKEGEKGHNNTHNNEYKNEYNNNKTKTSKFAFIQGTVNHCT